MALWCAAVLFAACFIGGIFVQKKWKRERKHGFLVLWIMLSVAAVVFALYTAMTFILLNAVS